MVLAAILYCVVPVGALFLFQLLLTILYRAYKTVLVRRVGFLRRRYMKPVDAQQAVLITGAGSGIGLAVAKHLYKVGYSIIATYYDSNEPGLAELKQLVQQNTAPGGSGKKFFIHQLDVTKEDQISHLFEQVSKQLDEHKLGLYGLINNAGVGSLQPFSWLQRKIICNLIDTNIRGPLLLTREFIATLARKYRTADTCRLLYVSSGLAFVPGPTYATYGTTKRALLYFSACMNGELKRQHHVQSVAIVPHNFIKNTNICSANVQNIESAWQDLKPNEREIFGAEYKEHLKRAKSLEEATKELSQRADRQQKIQRAAGSSSESSTNGLLQACKSVVNFLGNVLASLRGENRAASLEESGILECFEDALRLEDPPEVIFAGDIIFQLLIGSLLAPLTFLDLLGKFDNKDLYR